MPLDVAVVSGVKGRGDAAQDVDGEVMTAEQPVGAEAQDLLSAMGLDVIGERDLQASPRFTVDLDRVDLFGDEPGPCA